MNATHGGASDMATKKAQHAPGPLNLLADARVEARGDGWRIVEAGRGGVIGSYETKEAAERALATHANADELRELVKRLLFALPHVEGSERVVADAERILAAIEGDR
jgi:hypothetical protein